MDLLPLDLQSCISRYLRVNEVYRIRLTCHSLETFKVTPNAIISTTNTCPSIKEIGIVRISLWLNKDYVDTPYKDQVTHIVTKISIDVSLFPNVKHLALLYSTASIESISLSNLNLICLVCPSLSFKSLPLGLDSICCQALSTEVLNTINASERLMLIYPDSIMLDKKNPWVTRCNWGPKSMRCIRSYYWPPELVTENQVNSKYYRMTDKGFGWKGLFSSSEFLIR